MFQSLLADALAAGTSIITPNNRLAREVALRFDTACRAEGRRAWTPAQALPWKLWLDRLWLAALASHASAGQVLLDASASRELWHSVIAHEASTLMNRRGAVRHAVDAWTLFHAWRHPGESLARVAASGVDDDAQLFATCAERYRLELDALRAIDRAQLPDILTACATPSWARPLGRVALHGFIAWTPQQCRLLTTLRSAGVTFDDIPVVAQSSVRHRVACPTPAIEIADALGFARARLEAEPAARIAIVVADLEQRRAETVALAEEILSPEHLLSLVADAETPYGISLGEPLATAPLVATALDFIALSIGDIEAPTAASAIRSPFLPDAVAQWRQRADIERRWRNDGRKTVGWTDIVMTLGPCDPPLHRRFNRLTPPSRVARLPRQWGRAWSAWLAALGWPGSISLTSAQWQARDAWSNALAKFAASGMISGAVSAGAALEMLRGLLVETLWAPEAAPAQVQILGALEAAGLSFDHAWLAGFDAHRWPAAVSPNPFMSLRWQRERGVTRSHPDTALAQARQLTAQLSGMASEVIVSHAERIDDAPSAISPLFAQWPPLERESLPRAVRLSEAIAPVALERCSDEIAPPLAACAPIRGGAQLFESQSACPFQAFARFRLRGDAWAECPEGLSPAERGKVLHAVLKAFWDDVGDQTTLLGLHASELTRRITIAADAGKAKLSSARWRALPPAVAAAETRRLTATVAAWIEEGERVRPPFRVLGHEEPLDFDLEGVAVRVRVDRIDELDAGGLAVIDYKSGLVVKPLRWFGARPEGVQLALYAQGLQQRGDAAVRALAYAQVKAGEIAVSGLAERTDIWPGLEVAGSRRSRLPASDWQEVRSRMDDGLARLAREIRAGIARVAPRDGATCLYCRLKPLCRIRLLDDRDDNPGNVVDDE